MSWNARILFLNGLARVGAARASPCTASPLSLPQLRRTRRHVAGSAAPDAPERGPDALRLPRPRSSDIEARDNALRGIAPQADSASAEAAEAAAAEAESREIEEAKAELARLALAVSISPCSP